MGHNKEPFHYFNTAYFKERAGKESEMQLLSFNMREHNRSSR
jgi:hypothetical protein